MVAKLFPLLPLPVLLLGGCHTLLPFSAGDSTPQKNGTSDSRLDGVRLFDQRIARDGIRTGDRTSSRDKARAPDKSVPIAPSPCQLSWSGGWHLQGQSGVNCYGSCTDTIGGYSIDCDWAGYCTCSWGSTVKSCGTTSPCDVLVNAGCCKP